MELLLEQGRYDDAIRLVENAHGDSLVALAEALIEAGHAQPAFAAVRHHISVLDKDNRHTRRWLRAHGVDLPETVDTLVWTIEHFNWNPTIGGYKKIRAQAMAVGLWPQALAALDSLDPERTRLRPIRARMAADRGLADEALRELSGLADGTWRSCAADLAETFETSHVAVAMDLYEQLAEERAAHGTRGARKKARWFRERRAALAVLRGGENP